MEAEEEEVAAVLAAVVALARLLQALRAVLAPQGARALRAALGVEVREALVAPEVHRHRPTLVVAHQAVQA